MAWAKCSTHGPIQDARATLRNGAVVRLSCKCGLDCEPFEPESFVEHEELKVLVKSGKQPVEDHEAPGEMELALEFEEE